MPDESRDEPHRDANKQIVANLKGRDKQDEPRCSKDGSREPIMPLFRQEEINGLKDEDESDSEEEEEEIVMSKKERKEMLAAIKS